MMVDGCLRFPIKPGTTSTSGPKIFAQAAAVRAGFFPDRLALVETSAKFNAWHKRTASGCAVTRTAML